jgi:lysophospholipase L1-like esterase
MTAAPRRLLRTIPLRAVWGAPLLAGCLIALSSIDAAAAPITGFAAMGASESQGTTYSGSWVPWLAVDRKLNFGPSQSYNKAVGGATTTTLLSGGQHTKVASLVQSGDVDLAYLFIGGNDVGPVVLDMLLETLDVPTWADGLVGRMMTAADTVLAKNPTGMIIAGIPDMSLVPAGQPYKAIGAPVVAALDYTNSLIKAEVLARNQVYLDTAGLLRDLNASPFVVGGVTINMTTGSSKATHFFVDDSHPGTVGNGIFANLMITALNEGYGTSVALFDDQTILAKAGLSASYTGPTTHVDYAKYVYFNPVPEPASLTLTAIGLVALSIVVVRRRRRWRSNST